MSSMRERERAKWNCILSNSLFAWTNLPNKADSYSPPYLHFTLQDGQSRTVRQFQFTDWPEQGVPKSGEGFIDFIGQVHKTKEQFGQDGPISVHCR